MTAPAAGVGDDSSCHGYAQLAEFRHCKQGVQKAVQCSPYEKVQRGGRDMHSHATAGVTDRSL